MVMAVEAGELVEIFQWMTPEQSLAARDDAALRKIAKNAIKHPPA